MCNPQLYTPAGSDGSDGKEGEKKEKKGKGSYALVIWDMFVSVRVTVIV